MESGPEKKTLTRFGGNRTVTTKSSREGREMFSKETCQDLDEHEGEKDREHHRRL